MRLLWIIKPDVNAGIHNGANLRFYHCGRELREQRHNVYFLACRYFFQDNSARESLLADLKRQGSADECFTIADDVLATGSAWKRPFEIQTTRRRNEARRATANYLKTLIDEHGIDGCIISDAHIERSVVGVRSIIRSGATIRNSVIMGGDHFEAAAPSPAPAARGTRSSSTSACGSCRRLPVA